MGVGGVEVGADELHLFDESFLLGGDEVVIRLGLFDAAEALLQRLEAFEPGGEQALLARERGGSRFGLLQSGDFGGQGLGLGGGGIDIATDGDDLVVWKGSSILRAWGSIALMTFK